eukprot:111488_1
MNARQMNNRSTLTYPTMYMRSHALKYVHCCKQGCMKTKVNSKHKQQMCMMMKNSANDAMNTLNAQHVYQQMDPFDFCVYLAPQQDPHDLAPLYYCHPFSTRFTTFIYMETSKPIDLMHICTTSLSVYIQKHDAIDIHMHQFDAFLDDGAIQTKYSLFELKMKPRRKAKETSKD